MVPLSVLSSVFSCGADQVDYHGADGAVLRTPVQRTHDPLQCVSVSASLLSRVNGHRVPLLVFGLSGVVQHMHAAAVEHQGVPLTEGGQRRGAAGRTAASG